MRFRGLSGSIIIVASLAASASVAPAQYTENILFSWDSTNGGVPECTLVEDSQGNFYGTTNSGGTIGAPYGIYGTVFELSPAGGGTWNQTVLYNFGTATNDGFSPVAGVVLDAEGNLYGTTTMGGANGQGTFYEMVPGASGWTENILYNFGATSTDAKVPGFGNLIWDAAGNLYGTTSSGGTHGDGTVYEMIPGAGGVWTEKILYNFGATGGDASVPIGGLIFDPAGNLYGTTTSGGNFDGGGTVFELSPGAGGTWTDNVIHSFADNGEDGITPKDAPVMDAHGNLFGTAYNYGPSGSLGVVWELTPALDGQWSEQVLHGFTGTLQGDGDYPVGGLILDASGNLYGTTSSGGFAGEGMVYQMSPAAGNWNETILYGFATILLPAFVWDSHVPEAALLFDTAGNLYGTASSGGQPFGQYGTVFQITGVTTAAPLFSPAPGIFTTAQTITLSDTTSGAIMYYSINGGTTKEYTTPFTVSSSSFISAYAISPTLPQSQTVSAGYQIGSPTATPEFMPPAGTYPLAQSVTIVDADPSAVIHYAINATPSASSPVYTEPLDVSATETIKAIAIPTGMGLTNSAVASATYTITPPVAPAEDLLYSFGGVANDGLQPLGGLVSDANGNLYGTTEVGGSHGAGTAYELSLVGGVWTETILYDFGATGTDAEAPVGSLVFDSHGNLYGTSASGGTWSVGTVFELSPVGGSTPWNEQVLWNFGSSAATGETPYGGVIFDANGNLYGTTYQGGNNNTTWGNTLGGYGTVFELSPAGGGTWNENVIYTFGYLSQTDGYYPVAGLVFDSKGNLYGTTSDGGSAVDLDGGGTVFELTPNGSGPWTETILANFGGGSTSGYEPKSGVILDSAGNVYGTLVSGGNGYDLDGTLYELSPAQGGGWTQTILHSFGAYETDGVNPIEDLLMDANRNIYGVTYSGGSNQEGTVFELSPGVGGSWNEQVLYNFGASSTDAYHPASNLVFNSAGNLMGTSQYGGAYGSSSSGGTVYLLKTSASVPKSSQSISFAALPNVTYGVAPITLSATATSGLSVTFKLDSGPATLNGDTLTVTGVGTVEVEADQAGNGSYLAANPVQHSFTVSKATPSITWATPAPILYGTALSSTQLDASSPVGGTFVYTPAAGSVPAVGSQTLSVTLTPNNTTDYNSATKTVTLAVDQLAAMTSPTPSSTLKSSSVTFTWSAGTGVTEYDLYVGTTGVGSSNIKASGALTALTYSVSGIPATGGTVYVRLLSLIAGAWQHVDYTYTEATFAQLTSPTPGSTLTAASVAFSWTAGVGVTQYDLYVGTTGVGSSNIKISGALTAQTYTVTNIPITGGPLYVRLLSLVSGTWQSVDFTYTEADLVAPAVMSTPTPGSTLTGSSATFTWTAGTGVTQYDLYVGTTGVGSSNIKVSGSQTGTTYTVSGIPTTGGTVYVRLLSLIAGAWQHNDYTYTEIASTPAVMSTPAPGSTLTGSSATFTWTAGAGVTEYDLYVGTTGAGSSNIKASGALTALTYSVTGIPTTGGTVYVRLLSLINGVWQHNDYTYTEQ